MYWWPVGGLRSRFIADGAKQTNRENDAKVDETDGRTVEQIHGQTGGWAGS